LEQHQQTSNELLHTVTGTISVYWICTNIQKMCHNTLDAELLSFWS